MTTYIEGIMTHALNHHDGGGDGSLNIDQSRDQNELTLIECIPEDFMAVKQNKDVY